MNYVFFVVLDFYADKTSVKNLYLVVLAPIVYAQITCSLKMEVIFLSCMYIVELIESLSKKSYK